jgi:hypothetical protein
MLAFDLASGIFATENSSLGLLLARHKTFDGREWTMAADPSALTSKTLCHHIISTTAQEYIYQMLNRALPMMYSLSTIALCGH